MVEASPLWDRKVVNTQVSDSKEEALEIRLLVSAKNAPTAWDLRCEVREKMIDFLRDELPECLPKRRLDAPVTLARERQPVS